MIWFAGVLLLAWSLPLLVADVFPVPRSVAPGDAARVRAWCLVLVLSIALIATGSW